MPDRNLWLAGCVALCVASIAATYLVMHGQRVDADADAAIALADARESGAAREVELQGQLAACRLDHGHARHQTGDRTFDATVTATSGESRASQGDTCRVELDWSDDPLEGCRALVRCGTEWLYGDVGAGFFDCTVDGQGIVHGQDANPTSAGGDPRLVVDRLGSTLTLSDDAPAWSITLALPADEL